MKRFILSFVLIIILLSYTNTYASDNLNQNLKIIMNNVYDNYDIPDISGKVNNLPWRNNKDFLKAKENHDTPLLLAGFCAVLKNPLPGEEYNVRLASERIRGNIIQPSKIFSQNSTLGPYTKSKGYKDGASYIGGNIIMTEGGGVCKIATTLYNLAALSNLEIIERYNHSMPINYVPYGQDATVAYGVKDFRFKNTTDNTILIWSQMIDNRLYIGFYGKEKPPQVVWNHEVTNIIKPSIKYIKNEKLKPGEMVTILNGMDGATVKSTTTITKSDGSYKIKNMGTSIYAPLPKLIEIN
jgi:hypothetical protein